MEIIPNNVKILVIANMYGKSKTNESTTDSTKKPVPTQTPTPTQTTEYYKPSMTFSKLTSTDIVLFNPLIKLTDVSIKYNSNYKQLQFFIPDKFNELNKQNANSGKIIYTNDTNKQTIILEKDAIYLKSASLFSPSIKYTFVNYNPISNTNIYIKDDATEATLNLTKNIITIGKFQFNPTSSKTLLINNSNDGTVSNNIKLTLDNIFSANSTFNNYTIYNSKFDKNLWNFNTINYSDNYKNSIRVKKPKEIKFENLYSRIVEVLKKYYEGMYEDLNKPFLTLADDIKKNEAQIKYTNNNDKEVIKKFPLDKKNYSVVSSEVNTIIQKVFDQYLKTNINTNFFLSLDEYNLFIKYLKDIYENSKELDSKNIPYDVRWFKELPPYFYIKSKELDDKAFNSTVAAVAAVAAVATGKGAVATGKGAIASSGTGTLITGPGTSGPTTLAADKTLPEITPIAKKITELLAHVETLYPPLDKVNEALKIYNDAAAAATTTTTTSTPLHQSALNNLFDNLTKYQTKITTIIENQKQIAVLTTKNGELENELPIIHDCIIYHDTYGPNITKITDNNIKKEIFDSTQELKTILFTNNIKTEDIDKMEIRTSITNADSINAAKSLKYLATYERNIESLYKTKIREYENNLDEYIELETENKTLLFDMSNESTYSKDIAINNLKIDEIDKKIEYTINNFYDPDFIKTKAKLEKEKRKLDNDNEINLLKLENENEQKKITILPLTPEKTKAKIQKKIKKNEDKIKEIEEKQKIEKNQNKISGGQIGGSNSISLPYDLQKYFEQYKPLGDNIHKLIPDSSSSFVQNDISKMNLIVDSGPDPQEKQNFFNSILVAINNFNNANTSNQIQFTSKSWSSTSSYTIIDLYNELIDIFKKDIIDPSADIKDQFWFKLCKTIMKEINNAYKKKTYDEIKDDIENKQINKPIYKSLINKKLPIILNPSYNIGNDNLFIFNNKFYDELKKNNFKLFDSVSIEQMIIIFRKKMNISITYFYIDNNKIKTICELNAAKHNLFLYYNTDVFNLLSFNNTSMYYIPKGLSSTNDINFIKNINDNIFPPLLILLFLYITCAGSESKPYPFNYIETKIKSSNSSSISSFISTIRNYKFGQSSSASSASSTSYSNQLTITKSAYCYYITITIDLYEGKLPFMQKQTMGCEINRQNILTDFTELTGIKVLPSIAENKYLSLLPQDAAKPNWLTSITSFFKGTGLGTGLGTSTSIDANKGKPVATALNKPTRGGSTRRKIILTYKRQNNIKEIKARLSRKLHNITHKLFKI